MLSNDLFKLYTKTGNRLHRYGFGKLPFAHQVHAGLYRWLNDIRSHGVVCIDCQGSKMFINSDDTGVSTALFGAGVYEPFTTGIIKGLVAPGTHFVDIGANVGYYTLIAARQAGKRGHIYAFEPDPYNYDLLQRNVEVNHYENVTPARLGLSNKKGRATLYLQKDNLGAHSLSNHHLRTDRSVEIATATVDELFGEGRVDVIKMDVEGAEGLVLEGARQVLKKQKPTIVMEYAPYLITGMGGDPWDILGQIRGLGYQIRAIDDVRETVKEQSIAEIRKKFEACGDSYFNLLLKPA